MKAFLKIPKNQVIPILLLLFVIAAPRLGLLLALSMLLLCVGSTVMADLFFVYLRRRKLFLPLSGVITGLILTLIIDPSASWYQMVTVGASAMAIKNFLRIGGKHIFNPAASGLLVGFLLFGLTPGWWAPSPYTPGSISLGNVLIYLPILLAAYVSCRRYRRYNSVLSYLGFYLVSSFALSASLSPLAIISSVLSPGLLFYALVMLPEPMTSPVNKKRQLLYGVFVAVVTILVTLLSSRTSMSLFDVSLVALMLGNLVFFKFR